MSNESSSYIVVKEMNFDADNLRSIDISLIFESVELKVTDCENVKVTQYATEEVGEDWHFVNFINGHSLEVKSAYKTNIYMDIAPSQKYIVELPKNFTERLTITNVTGATDLYGRGKWSNLAIKSTSGDVRVEAFAGSGSLKSTSGLLDISISELTGNLSLQTVNGSICAGFEQSANAHIDSHSLSGSIQSEYPTVKMSGGTVNTGFSTINIGVNRKASGTIGNQPRWTVKMQTTTGSINLASK